MARLEGYEVDILWSDGELTSGVRVAASGTEIAVRVAVRAARLDDESRRTVAAEDFDWRLSSETVR
jgi:hypothetical protein